MDPLEKTSEEKKQSLKKIEEMLDGVYKDESIEAKDYKKFMEKYTEDFEAKLKENPSFKFAYKEVAVDQKK